MVPGDSDETDEDLVPPLISDSSCMSSIFLPSSLLSSSASQLTDSSLPSSFFLPDSVTSHLPSSVSPECSFSSSTSFSSSAPVTSEHTSPTTSCSSSSSMPAVTSMVVSPSDHESSASPDLSPAASLDVEIREAKRTGDQELVDVLCARRHQLKAQEMKNTRSRTVSMFEGVPIIEECDGMMPIRNELQANNVNNTQSFFLQCSLCLKNRSVPRGICINNQSWKCSQMWWTSRVGDCSSPEDLLVWSSMERVKWTGLPRAFVERSALHESFYYQLCNYLEAEQLLFEFPCYRRKPIELFVVHSYAESNGALNHLSASDWAQLLVDLRLFTNPEDMETELADIKNVIQDVSECMLANFVFEADKIVSSTTSKPIIPQAPPSKRARVYKEEDRGLAQLEARVQSKLAGLEKAVAKQFTDLRSVLSLDVGSKTEHIRTRELVSVVRNEAEARSELIAKALNLLIVDHFEREQRILKPLEPSPSASVVQAAGLVCE